MMKTMPEPRQIQERLGRFQRWITAEKGTGAHQPGVGGDDESQFKNVSDDAFSLTEPSPVTAAPVSVDESNISNPGVTVIAKSSPLIGDTGCSHISDDSDQRRSVPPLKRRNKKTEQQPVSCPPPTPTTPTPDHHQAVSVPHASAGESSNQGYPNHHPGNSQSAVKVSTSYGSTHHLEHISHPLITVLLCILGILMLSLIRLTAIIVIGSESESTLIQSLVTGGLHPSLVALLSVFGCLISAQKKAMCQRPQPSPALRRATLIFQFSMWVPALTMATTQGLPNWQLLHLLALALSIALLAITSPQRIPECQAGQISPKHCRPNPISISFGTSVVVILSDVLVSTVTRFL
jgi:hypothetical protein